MDSAKPDLLLLWVALGISYFVMCLNVALAADEKRRDGLAWFFLALVTSPIFAVLLLIARGEKQQEPAKKAAALPVEEDSTYAIARGPVNLGDYRLSQIRLSLGSKTLRPTDLYWDVGTAQWLELAAHPRLV